MQKLEEGYKEMSNNSEIREEIELWDRVVTDGLDRDRQLNLSQIRAVDCSRVQNLQGILKKSTGVKLKGQLMSSLAFLSFFLESVVWLIKLLLFPLLDNSIFFL